jgi:ribosomal protein S18 acetylase RimI-like enzyme
LAIAPSGVIDGIAVFAPGRAEKTRHRGNLFSMYVRRASRGRGIGDALVRAVLEAAAEPVLQVHCAVVVGNEPAQRLYERHGFSIYGTEPRALAVGGRFYDEHLMVCTLR